MDTHLDTLSKPREHTTPRRVFLGRTVDSGRWAVSACPCNEHIVEGWGWGGWLHWRGGPVGILLTFVPVLLGTQSCAKNNPSSPMRLFLGVVKSLRPGRADLKAARTRGALRREWQGLWRAPAPPPPTPTPGGETSRRCSGFSFMLLGI